MILLTLVISLTVFLFASFTMSFRLSTINRAIINTPIDIMEVSIPIVNIDETNLYFNKSRLENRVLTYYQESISQYFKTYDVDFYYYNQADKSICVSDYCNAVEITVNGNYMFNFSYERSITFEIHKGAKYGQWKNCFLYRKLLHRRAS